MKAEITVVNNQPILTLHSESPAEDDVFQAVDLLDKYTLRFAWQGDSDELDHQVHA